MRGAVNLKIGVSVLLTMGGTVWMLGGGASCGTAPTPFIVHGPGTSGNDPPTLTILEPNRNITVSQGEQFLIHWTDTDSDDNAQISFSLTSTTSPDILLVEGIDENDTIGPDRFTVSGSTTSLLQVGTYNVLGTIEDSENPPVEVYALVGGATVQQRVIVTIVGPGEGPQSVPPRITITEPAFNLSIAQDDVLRVAVQPSAAAPDPAIPYDPDSNVRLFILLDLDQNPNNDDPANPDLSEIIVLRDQTIQTGAFDAIPFEVAIDLAVVPPRPGGEPYHTRATVDDGTNPRVHEYAIGTISVVRLAAATVDLFDIGRTKSGARFYGFNPGANLGSNLSHVGDFDADGVDDFVLVAQFGNPQNFGPVGEAYLIYGRGRLLPDSPIPVAGDRFGGTISVNSVSDSISGAVFQAPPVRSWRDMAGFGSPPASLPGEYTEGITDVDFIRDLTGDGRPEILFGLPHVMNVYDSTDYDPDDSEPSDVSPWGCYPDPFVNNLTDDDQDDPVDVQFHSGGMAVIVNSQNRDNAGLVNPDRLDETSVALELVGQNFKIRLGPTGRLETGDIAPRADNNAATNIGNDSQEPGRIAGARLIAGGYDFEDALFSYRFGGSSPQPPREGLFGQTIASIGDLNNDGLDEIIISAPRNERYLQDLLNTYGYDSTHWWSTMFQGSIVVHPGRNYNQDEARDISSNEGTSQVPPVDQHRWPPYGRCGNPPEWREYAVPLDSFDIYAEDIDDRLGGGRSAGDFNQDGIDDILCAAPLNDRTSSLVDTGAVYIIYGRGLYGGVNLSMADDPALRPPMLRIRGLKPGDQIGWRATSGLDVNGDRIDDVFIASPRADYSPHGGVTRSTCIGTFVCDESVDPIPFSLQLFNGCEASVGEEVFCDDPCKAFDYDNDGDIDDEDRCVFCCLSDDCEPETDCVFGHKEDCCENLVDNGFVGIIFGGVFIDGDRNISQLATSQLPGTRFYGTGTGHRAGLDVSSAGDFNQDGFGDILISAPGEMRLDDAGRERLGVVYLVFGGTHLINTTWDLKNVGSEELPGIVFLSPYVAGRPNEAAPTTVGYIGDINNDGFGDIAIGNPKADFIDLSYPQGPDAPGSDASTGRRSNVGDVYVIYGNNFGPNRGSP